MFFFGTTRTVPTESAEGVAAAVVIAFDGVADVAQTESVEGITESWGRGNYSWEQLLS